MDLSKLPKMDPDAEKALNLLDRLLSIRRSIEAEASRETINPAAITSLEQQQAGIFRELHQTMDSLDAKTR